MTGVFRSGLVAALLLGATGAHAEDWRMILAAEPGAMMFDAALAARDVFASLGLGLTSKQAADIGSYQS